MRDVLHSRWMIAAILVEILAVVAALGTIPGLGPFPVVAMLSATAILSSFGVVIVTTYFVVQYNKRPLNPVQKKEIGEILEAYPTLQKVEEAFASKSQLASLGEELRSFFNWRYQNSVVDFASEVQELRRHPGYILVAELEPISGTAHIIRFTSVPPPVPALADPRGSAGDTLPELFSDYDTLFLSDTVALVVYVGVESRLRALQFNPQTQNVFYHVDLLAPVIEAVQNIALKPQLTRSGTDQGECRWCWTKANV